MSCLDREDNRQPGYPHSNKELNELSDKIGSFLERISLFLF